MAHIRKRGPQRYQARYRSPDGKEHSKTFVRKIDAERFLATVEADKARGAWRDPRLGRQTFKDWVEEYLASATHKRESTMARDRTVLRCHFVSALGSMPLVSITPHHVRQVVEKMSANLAPKTVRTNYGVLRAVLHAAVEADRSQPALVEASACLLSQRAPGASSQQRPSRSWPTPCLMTTGSPSGWVLSAFVKQRSLVFE